MRRLLGIGKPKAPPVAGDIACYGLSAWWLGTFTEQERALIRRTYKPLGSGAGYAIDTGDRQGCDKSQTASLLGGLASWFKDRKYDRIQFAILTETERHAKTALEQHFAYSQFIEYWYRLRDEREGARDQAIAYCQRQIGISKDAAKAWRRKHGYQMPSHVGFKQLAVILRERRRLFPRYPDLQASEERWLGRRLGQADRAAREEVSKGVGTIGNRR